MPDRYLIEGTTDRYLIEGSTDVYILEEPERRILLVVGDAAVPVASDLLWAERLTALGHTYTYISDETAEPDLTPYYGIVIGESVATGTLGTKYLSAPKPLLSGEGANWDTWGFATLDGNVVAQPYWQIVSGSESHPLAVSMASRFPSGLVWVGSGDWREVNTADFGAGNAAVQKIWYTDPPTNTLVACFAYESGATMASGIAVDRRVAIGYHNATPIDESSYFVEILDACIRYAFTAAAGQWREGPIVQSQAVVRAGSW